jgi:hypothetical protein
MFYEIYKGYQTKKKKKRKKRWLFEEIISHYGILLEIIILPFNMMAQFLII